MPIVRRRPRPGRLLDVLVISLCLIVLVGLAVYHYRRLDHSKADADLLKELASRKFAWPPTSANDWPNWRGPNHDGFSTESDVLTEWPKDGPRALWEQPTGKGFGSVAVADGRVYLLFQQDKNEAVLCWDAESGKERWRFEYECDYRNSYGDGPRSTPSVDGEFVYTVGAKGNMHCLKIDNGKVEWSKNLLEEFSARIPEWGIAFSPLVEGERVFIMPGGSAGQGLAALDKKTGKVLWKKHDDLASYSSPIPATIYGERQILFLTGIRLVSVDPATGDERWSYPWAVQQQANIATPIVIEDYVFLSSYYGKGSALLKIAKTGNEWNAKLVYEKKKLQNHIGTSVRHRDHIYGFDDKILKCMDIRTGEFLWDQRGFDKGSVLAFDDQLIVYGANGNLALIEASPKDYVEKANFEFSSQGRSCWSVPVLANGRLYVRDWQKLVCLDVKAKSR